MLLPALRRARAAQRLISLISATCLVAEPAMADTGYFFRLNGTGNEHLLSIQGPAVVYGHVNGSMADAYVARGGDAPYLWGATGLPAGLSVADGKLSGVPAAGGTTKAVVAVTDADGATATLPIEVDVLGELLVTGTQDLETGVGVPARTVPLSVTGSPVAPVTFKLASGQLPPGMAVDAATGAVAGTPTVVGSYAVSVVAADATGADAVSASFTITVDDMLQAASGGNHHLVARQGVPYVSPYPVLSGGAQPPLAWSLQAGAVPAGLAVEPATGRLSGTAAQVSALAPLTLKVIDGANRYGKVAEDVTVLAPLSFAGVSASAFVGYVRKGVPGSYVPPQPGPKPQDGTWSLASGALPPGMRLDRATGAVTGTPSSPGAPDQVVDATFALAYAEATGGSVTTPTITLHDYGPLFLDRVADASFPIGQAVRGQPETFVGRLAGDFAWKGGSAKGVPAALPVGIAVDPATGALSGTAAYGFTRAATTVVTDQTGTFASNAYTLSAAAKFPMPGDVADVTGRVGTPLAIAAPRPGAGYAAPLAFSVRGQTPPGLSIDRATGAISGTPTEAGPSGLAVVATDATGAASGTNTFTITILPAVSVGFVASAATGAYPTGTTAASTHQGFQLSLPMALANAPAAPVAWSADASSTLPPGLILTPNPDHLTETLSGSLAQPGDYAFVVDAVDARGNAASATVSLHVVPPISTTAPTLLARVGTTIDAKSGYPYGGSKAGTVSNAVGPTRWFAPDDGTYPPAGLFFDSPGADADGVPILTGALTGVAQGPAGPVDVEIGVRDALDTSDQPSRAISPPGPGTIVPRLDISPQPAPTLSDHAGVALAPTPPLTVVNGPVGAVTFAMTGDLPEGMSFDPATGSIAGTPQFAGDSRVAVLAYDSIYENTPSYYVSIHVDYAMQVGDGSAPTGPYATRAGSPVRQPPSPPAVTNGGGAPYAWSLYPAVPGVALDASGNMSGTPTTPGGPTAESYRVVDATGQIGLSAPFQMTVLPPLALSTSDLAASVGTPVDVTLAQPTPGAVSPVTWAIGPLPAGLVADPATGRVTGTPTTLGDTTVNVAANDGVGDPADATFKWSIVPPITIGTGPNDTTYVGAPSYSRAAPSLASNNGKVTWSLDPSSTLPEGLALDPGTGTISGVPTKAMVGTVTLRAVDSVGGSGVGSPFTITVTPPLSISATPYAGREGVNWRAQTFSATGGAGTPSLAFGAPVPPKFMSMDASGGVTANPPAGSAKTYPLAALATDTDGETGSASTTATILPPLTLSVPDVEARLGQPLSFAVPAIGNSPVAPVAWAPSTMPDGLRFDAPTTAIVGTPTTAGNTTATLSATDAQGARVKSNAFAIAVRGPLTIAMSSSSLASHLGQTTSIPAPTVGTNPKPKLSFALGGSLPPGLSMAADGSISGTATQQVVTTATITVTDGFGATATTDPFTVTVLPPLAVGTVANGKGRVAYETQMTQAGDVSGNPVLPLSWKLASGTLPDGTTLDPRLGTISGTPTATATRTLSLSVSDATGASVTTNYFTLSILPQLAVAKVAGQAVHVGQAMSIPAPVPTAGLVAPAKWTLSGTLPAGVYMDPATGAISGATVQATDASNTVTVTVSDGTGASATSNPFVAAVYPPLAMDAIPDLVTSVGHAETVSPKLSNAIGTVAYAATAPPDGMAVDAKSGALAGAATGTGATTVTLTATDAAGASVARSYAVTVVGDLALAAPTAITTRVGRQATIPAPVASNVVPPLGAFAAAVGYALPQGFAMDPATGIVTGTPQMVGATTFAYQTTDGDGRSATSNETTINVYSPLTIGDAGTFVMRDGVPASVPAPSVGNKPVLPGNWTLAQGSSLPQGFDLDPTSGTVSGTPGASLDGTSTSFALTFVDGQGALVSNNAPGQPAQVSFLPPLTLGDLPTLYAHQGQAYDHAAPQVGGGPVAPLSWSVASGPLPPGLTVGQQSGRVAGTATKVGTYQASLSVADATQGSATNDPFTVTVLPTLTMAPGTNLTGHNDVRHDFPAPALTNGSPVAVWSAGTAYPNTSVDPATGTLTFLAGVAPGVYAQTLSVDDDGVKVGSGQFKVTILPPLAVSAPSAPLMLVGKAGAVPAPAVQNPSGATTFSVLAGALPPGMTLDVASGAISGSPTASGNFPVSLSVADAAGGVASTATFNVAVADAVATAAYPSSIATARQPDGGNATQVPVGALYDASTATTATVPYGYGVVLTFPKAVAADSVSSDAPASGTGASGPSTGLGALRYNAGTPSSPVFKALTPGSAVVASQFLVPVTGGPLTLSSLRLGLAGAFPDHTPSITSAPRQTPTQGQAWSVSLASLLASKDVEAGEAWAIVAGTLPDGLALDPSGTISGTPTTVGDATLSLAVTDGRGVASVPATVTISVQSSVGADQVLPTSAYDVGSGAIARNTFGNAAAGTTQGLSPHHDAMPVATVYDQSPATAATAYAAQFTQYSIGWIYSLTNFWSGAELDFAQPVRWDGTADAHASGSATLQYWYNAGTAQSPNWVQWTAATGTISASQFQVIGVNQSCANCGYAAPSRSFVLDTARLGFGGHLPPYAPTISSGMATVANTAPASVSLASALDYQGGSGAPTWALTNGALPPGLTLSAAGTIGGTTTVATTTVVDLTFVATDATGVATAPATLHLTAAAGPVLYAASQGLAVNQPASVQLAAAMSATNLVSATWTATGLPSTLSLSTSGVLSGTPTTLGRTVATVTVTNGNGQATSQPLTLNVDPAPSLSAASAYLSQGVAGSIDLTKVMSATNLSGATYVATNLPLATTVSAAGVLSGASLDEGPFAVQVTATTPDGLVASATLSLTVVVPPILSAAPATIALGRPAALDVTTIMSPTGVTGATYAAQGLPSPLSMTPAGVVAGTPTATGTYAVTVTATNVDGTTGSNTLTLSVDAPPSLSAAGKTIVVGQPASLDLSALMGGNPATSPSYAATGLPAGLSLSAAGLLTGTPTAIATLSVPVTATDPDGLATTATLSLGVTYAPTLTNASDTAYLGASYGKAASTLMAPTYLPSPTWAITGLPPGMTASASTGTISGAATAAGTYVANVVATASNGLAATGTITLQVANTAPASQVYPVSATTQAGSVAVAALYDASAATTVTIPSAYGGGANAWVEVDYAVPVVADGSVDTDAASMPLFYNSATSGSPVWTQVTGTVTASQFRGYDQSGTSARTITLSRFRVGTGGAYPAPLPSVSPATLVLPVGIAANASLDAVMAPADVQGAEAWASVGSAQFPTGLSLTQNGTVTGTPVGMTSATTNVTVADARGIPSAAQSLTIQVVPQPGLANGSTTIAAGRSAGVDVSKALSATGATGGAWAATGLPAGMALSAAGILSGTPTATGAVAATVTLTQGTGPNALVATATLTVNVDAAPGLTQASVTLQTGVAASLGLPAAMAAANATGATYAATGLPATLSVSPGGTLTGTPTTLATYVVPVTATNPDGLSTTANLSLTVAAPPALANGSDVAYVGGRYQGNLATALAATGLSTPTWSQTGLPSGLALDPATGLVTGTSPAAGSYPVAVTVTNANGLSGSATLTLVAQVPTLNTALVAYWAYEDGAGTTAVDSTGAYPLTLKRPTLWSTGVVGGGLAPGLFDAGSNGAFAGRLTGAAARTESAWFQGTSTGGSLVDWGSHSAGNASMLGVDSSGHVYLSDWNVALVGSQGGANDGRWHLATATYDGSLRTIYLDGVAVGSDSATENTTASAIIVGAGIGGSSGSIFQGTVDEVGVWGRALSAPEVASLYNSGSGSTAPFTVATPSLSSATAVVAAGQASTVPLRSALALATGYEPTWAISGAPAGVTVDPRLGVLSVPASTPSGTTAVAVTATNFGGASASATLTLAVDAPPSIGATSMALPLNASSSTDLARAMSLRSGSSPTWTATGLPGGLALSADGILSGTLASSGPTTATVTVTNGDGLAAMAQLTVSGAVPAASSLGSGLVAFYALDDGAGTTAADSSGNGNTLTTSPATTALWTASGQTGGAAQMDGSHVFQSASTLITTQSRSTSAWIRTTSTGAAMTIMTGGRAAYYGDSIGLDASGKANASVGSGNGSCTAAGTNGLADGTWHQVVMTYDATALKLYVDGAAQAVVACSKSTNTGPLQIGGYVTPGFNSSFFTGTIDQVGAWNRALSASEVASLYDGGTGNSPVVVSTAANASLHAGSALSIPAPTVSGAHGTPLAFAATGALPTGATISSTTGAVTGTVTTAGTYAFGITATDPSGNQGASGTTTVTVLAALTATTPASTTVARGASTTVPGPTVSNASGSVSFAIASGSVPVGMTLSTTTGAVTGSPSTAGTYGYALTATDAVGGTSTTGTTTVQVDVPPAITAATTNVATGQAASLNLASAMSATGLATPTWTATGLPASLTLSTAGVLSGSASASGSTSVAVTVTNGDGLAASATLTVVASAPPTLTAASKAVAANAPANVNLATLMAAQNASGATYAATGLPGTLSVSAAGVLSGTPTSTGSYAVTVTATNPTTGGTGSATLTLSVDVPPSITAATTNASSGQPSSVGLATAMSATGLATPTWTATGLPSWATLSSGGTLSGTPNAAGTTTATVTVTNADGLSAAATLSITVAASLSISNGTATATTGTAYSGSLPALMAATGLSSPTWSVSGLPAGLALTDAANGVISGTPTSPATSSVSVTVANAGGATATATLTLAVNGASPTALLSSGMIDYWRFDEGAGSTATDSVGGRSLAFAAAPTWGPGVSGNAVTVSGSTTASTTFGTLAGAAPRTIATWFRTTDGGTDLVGGWGATSNNQMSALAVVSGTVGFVGYNNDMYTTARYNDGAWHHLAYTYDGATGSLYVDGSLAKSMPQTLATASSAFSLAKQPGSGSYPFVGSLDEMGVWNRALSAAEVQNLYAAKAPPAGQTAGAGLLALFHMDEGSGSTITDSVSGRVATVTNAAWTATGASGSALTFNGSTTSYATTPWGQVTGAAPKTLAAWVRTTATGAYSTAAGFGNLSGTGTSFALCTNGSSAGFCGSTTNVLTPQTYGDGNWHMMAATYDGTTVRTYFDGVAAGSLATTLATASAPLLVGANVSGQYAFTGSVDETGVWGRALSASEIATLYNAGTPAKTQNVVNLASGLVASWHLDEGAGTTSADATGAWPLTLASPAWTTGKVGNALAPAGTASTIASNAGFSAVTGAAPRTMSTWFRTTGNGTLMEWGSNGSNGLSELNVYNGAVQFAAYSNDTATPGTGYSDGNWHLATATYDGATTARIYMDGQLVVTKTVSPFATASGNLTFGGRYGSTAQYLAGAVDEAAVWNRALNASEVSALYANGAGQAPDQGSPTSGQVAYWKLDEATGSATVADSVGSANGTWSGTSGSGAAGVVNTGASFSGSNYVSLGTPAAIEGLQLPLTIAGWVNYAGGSNAAIYGGYGTNSAMLSLLRIDNGNLTYWASKSNSYQSATGPAVPTGGWHFVAATVTGTVAAPVVTVTVDGTAKTTALGSALSSTPPSPAIYIGGDVAGDRFTGSVDELGVWNRALSSAELQTLYLSRSPSAAPTLSSGAMTAIIGQTTSQSAATAMGATPSAVTGWAVTGGSLPTGLTMDPATGLVSGAAQASGTWAATVTATGRNGAIASATLTVTVTQATTTTGLLDLWHLDEGAGAVASDSVGGRNATVSSATWGTGVSGSALTFSNSTSSNAKAAFSGLTGAAPRTMGLWFKATSAGTAGLMGYGTSSSGQQAALQFTNGLLMFTGFNADVSTSQTPYLDGNWHQVVYTYDGARGTLYVDGAAKASAAQTLNTVGSGTMYVGGGANGDASLAGSVDEPAVWNRALSAAEVSQLFAQRAPQTAQTVGDGLVAMFHMDEGSGATTTDSVVGRVGTLGTGTGAASWTTGITGSALAVAAASTPAITAPWNQLQGAAPRSSSTWFKTTAAQNSALLFYGTVVGSQASMWSTGLSSSGTVGLNTSAGPRYFTPPTPYNDGNWHDLVVTYDGATETIYLDGNRLGTNAETLVTGASSLQIGVAGYTGTMDETAVWSRSLSAAEVAAVYNGGTPSRVANAVNLTQGQVAYYRFEDQTGTTAADSMGAFPLTLSSGSIWSTAGKVGGGLALTGSQYGTSSSFSGVTGASPRTMSEWFKTTSTSSASLFGFGSPSNNQMSQMTLSGTGQVQFGSYYNDMPSTQAGYNDGKWHLATFTYDGATRRLYVDGALQTSDATTTMSTASGNLWVGEYVGGQGGFFNGSLDEVGIWNRALNTSEVAALYNQGTGTSPNAPTGLSAGSASAVAGQAFNGSAPTLMGATGVLPASWSVIAGALPPGIGLDPASGALSGTAPSTTGSYVATIQAAGQNGATASATLAITVGSH